MINWTKRIPPDGQRGTVQVLSFDLTPNDVVIGNLRAAINGMDYMMAQPGRYCKLVIGGEIVMSNTDMERRTNKKFVQASEGDVLIFGLGIGMVLNPLLDSKLVRSITVVEKNPDVIALVAPTFASPKLKVIEGDAHLWKPKRGQRFDSIWFDIWPTICEDNLLPMLDFRIKARKWLRDPRRSFVGCWSEDLLRRLPYDRRRGHDAINRLLEAQGRALAG